MENFLAKNFETIILTGIKHSGKSTLAKILAQKLNTQFFDTDLVIHEMTGKSAREIFSQFGRNEFLKAEENACQKIFPIAKNAIVATGGGICENPEAWKIVLGAGKIVFLQVSEECARNRILSEIQFDAAGKILDLDSVPAFLKKNPVNTQQEICKAFSEFYKARTKIYEKNCALKIDVSKNCPEKNAEKILLALNAFPHNVIP